MEATRHASENHAYVESRNPATGEVIARLEATQPDDLPGILRRASAAQANWEAQPVSRLAVRACGAFAKSCTSGATSWPRV